MKRKASLSWVASALLCCTTAVAQQETPPAGAPPPPPPAPGAERGPQNGPPEEGPRRGEGRPPHEGHDRRPEAGPRDDHRPQGGPRDGGRPEGGPRDGDRPPGGPRDGGRPEGGPRDGDRPHNGPREGGRPEGGPRDGERGGPRGHGPGEPGGPGSHEGASRGWEAEAPRTPQPFMGVIAMPVDPPLAAQLGLSEGFGLLVGDVLPNSPAATAGVQKFDVLKMLNDQQLTNPAQLAALVRAAGKDKEVALTVLRKAQEQKLTVKVGERIPSPGAGPHPGGRMEPGGMPDRLREFHERMRHEMEERRQRPEGGPEGRGGHPRAEVRPEDLLRQAQPGGGAPIELRSDSTVTTLESAKARLLLKDPSGEIEVAGENGQRTLTARDPQGAVLFTGPVNTEAERQAVPEAYRMKLAAIHLRPLAESGASPQAAEGDVQ